MIHIFENNGAFFSNCRKYRYCLYRTWDKDKPKVMFIGLNPSTANENTDDPTIRRVVSFSKKWGYGSVYMLNLFPRVSADPVVLLDFMETPFHDVEAKINNSHLKGFAGDCKEIIFAWGSFDVAKERAKEVIAMFPEAKALLINKDGSPRHPLYVPGDTQPIKFRSI